MLEELMSQNKKWAKQRSLDFFSRLARGQSPKIFWIGCCDSRVIPTEICDLSLDDVFLKTNIANQVNPNDLAMMSALEYALETLHISNIIVCGHTHCAGIKAATNENPTPNLVEDWIRQLRELYQDKKNKLPKGEQKLTALSRLNIRRQISTLKSLPLVQTHRPKLHGLLFDIETGLIETV